MKQKQYAPGAQGQHAGTQITTSAVGKGTNILVNLPYHQKRILNLLSDGVPRSAADITIALGMSDPRSAIRNLRAHGIAISDEWRAATHGSRYKRYFIRKGGVR